MNGIQRISHVRSGQPIRAQHHNALAEAIAELQEAVFGQNRATSSDPNSVVAAVLAALLPDILIPVRIVAVNAADGDDQPNVPSQVTYHIKGIVETGIEILSATPWYGRPVRDDTLKIIPAREGSIAFLVRAPKAFPSIGEEGEMEARLMLLPGDEIHAVTACGA